MRETSKILLFALIIFILSALGITIWYLMELGRYEETVGFASVKNILFRFGFIGAIPCTVLFSLGYISYLKIKKKWLVGTILIILGFLLYLSSFWFLWYVSIRSLTKDPFVG